MEFENKARALECLAVANHYKIENTSKLICRILTFSTLLKYQKKKSKSWRLVILVANIEFRSKHEIM